jgi:capsular exopolysaccharide synthesis family protein
MSKLGKALEKAKQEREDAPEGGFAGGGKLAQAFARASVEPGVAAREPEPASVHPQAQPLAPAGEKEAGFRARKAAECSGLDCDVLESNRIMTHLDFPRVEDYYDLLRTQILQRTRDRGWNSLMITSAAPGEGKTLTAINLALSLGREMQQTALLVELDFRHPRICKYLGLGEDTPGLSDYLLHDASLPSLMISPGFEKMSILPVGRPMAGSTDILGAPKMQRLVQELKSRYPDRYVIYDCPCLLNRPDTLVFSSYVDGVILVAAAGRTPRKDISRTVAILREQQINIVGMVMNKAELATEH